MINILKYGIQYVLVFALVYLGLEIGILVVSWVIKFFKSFMEGAGKNE